MGFSDGTEKVCKLEKTLYGLKQRAAEWYRTISGFLVKLGYNISTVEPCVFLYGGNDLPKTIHLYVDDMVMIVPRGKELSVLLKILDSEFGVKDLGKPEFLLEIKVTRSKKGIMLCQEAYIHELLEKFDND
jgi:hypothetical protein